VIRFNIPLKISLFFFVQALKKENNLIMEMSWATKYKGNRHLELLESLQNTKGRDYAHVLAIVQSSGYGKSRLVNELAKLVFTIPINVRLPSDEMSMWFLCLCSIMF